MQAAFRNPRLSHLVEALPSLSISTDNIARLSFAGRVARCFVDPGKIYNQSESGYHATVIGCLMDELIGGVCEQVLSEPKEVAEAPAAEPQKAPAKKKVTKKKTSAKGKEEHAPAE